MKQFGSYKLYREGEQMGNNNNTSGAAAEPVSVPVGFRFQPTEEELVNHYLRNKLQGMDSHIPEIDVCKYEPSDLPALLVAETETVTHALEWFFFSPRDYKYTNSTRSNRTTQKGYWKITGKERAIKARLSKVAIGKKRTLTFYEGRASRSPKPKKTNWVIHEYYLIDTETPPNPKQAKMDFVLCRLKNKSDKKDSSICPESEPGSPIVSNSESQAAGYMTPEPQENGESLFYQLQPQEYSSSTLQSPIELGDVLQANGNSDGCNELQSPFGDNGSSLTDRNDISTCDEGEAPSSYTVFDFENQAANNTMMELFAQPKENLDSLFYQQAIQQAPIYCNDEYNMWKSPLGENDSFVTYKNHISTHGHNKPVNYTTSDFLPSYTMSDFENQAADDMMLEPFAQPENSLDSLLHPTQPHQSQYYYSSTLQSPIYTNPEPFAQPENSLDSLLHPTQPHQSQYYYSSTLQSPIYTNLEPFAQPENSLDSLLHPTQPHQSQYY